MQSGFEFWNRFPEGELACMAKANEEKTDLNGQDKQQGDLVDGGA
jgi:hypothetical protein